MKIGEGNPPVPPTNEGVSESAAPGKAPEEAPFAERLDEAGGAFVAEPKGGVAHDDMVSLAARLDAGEIAPAEAAKLLVERVLDAQLGPDASPELREQTRALVQASLETDPLLSGLVKRLGGGS